MNTPPAPNSVFDQPPEWRFMAALLPGQPRKRTVGKRLLVGSCGSAPFDVAEDDEPLDRLSCREKTCDFEDALRGLEGVALSDKKRRVTASSEQQSPQARSASQGGSDHGGSPVATPAGILSSSSLDHSYLDSLPRRAIAHSAFEAVMANYLALSPGDCITVVAELSDGWLEGVAPDGRRGQFPPFKVDSLADVAHEAALGNVAAQMELGVRYDNGYGVPRDEVEAAQHYRRAATQGYSRAQYKLALCLDGGMGIERNEAEAAEWYRKAAKQGHAGAQFNLGVCYRDGTGVAVNESKARVWFRRAAGQGHAKAQAVYGVACLDGTFGVMRDLPEAARWFALAAKQGHAGGQYRLAVCLEFGIGIAKDEAAAVHWYRKGADQFHGAAACRLGLSYEYGRGVATDVREAVRWYQIGAEQDHSEAMHHLARCYRFGIGVAVSDDSALIAMQHSLLTC